MLYIPPLHLLPTHSCLRAGETEAYGGSGSATRGEPGQIQCYSSPWAWSSTASPCSKTFPFLLFHLLLVTRHEGEIEFVMLMLNLEDSVSKFSDLLPDFEGCWSTHQTLKYLVYCEVAKLSSQPSFPSTDSSQPPLTVLFTCRILLLRTENGAEQKYTIS